MKGIPPELEKQLAEGAAEFSRARAAALAERGAPVPRRLPHACCDKAVPLACVCAYAYRCEVHGDKHVGRHD